MVLIALALLTLAALLLAAWIESGNTRGGDR